mgnify:CR=1 FL=1
MVAASASVLKGGLFGLLRGIFILGWQAVAIREEQFQFQYCRSMVKSVSSIVNRFPPMVTVVKWKNIVCTTEVQTVYLT